MNELMLEIYKLVLQKNQRNKNTIFSNYYGNVNCFDIQVFKNGWNEKIDADFRMNLYLDINSETQNRAELTKIIEYLKSLED